MEKKPLYKIQKKVSLPCCGQRLFKDLPGRAHEGGVKGASHRQTPCLAYPKVGLESLFIFMFMFMFIFVIIYRLGCASAQLCIVL